MWGEWDLLPACRLQMWYSLHTCSWTTSVRQSQQNCTCSPSIESSFQNTIFAQQLRVQLVGLVLLGLQRLLHLFCSCSLLIS